MCPIGSNLPRANDLHIFFTLIRTPDPSISHPPSDTLSHTPVPDVYKRQVQEAAKKSPEQIKKFSNLSQRLFILSQSIFCDPGLPMRPKMRYFSIPSILFMHSSIVFLGAATLILWLSLIHIYPSDSLTSTPE